MKLWIARNGYGQLYLFKKEPVCDYTIGEFFPSEEDSAMINLTDKGFDVFPDLEFDDSPIEVELKAIEDIY